MSSLSGVLASCIRLRALLYAEERLQMTRHHMFLTSDQTRHVQKSCVSVVTTPS